MEILEFFNINGEIVDIRYKSQRYINVNNKSNLKLPTLYTEKRECSGCSACYSMCPKSSMEVVKMIVIMDLGEIGFTGAITMMPDDKGFMYPVIDADMCIGCRKCEAVCPFK